MPQANNSPNELPDIRVVLRTPRGQYIASDDNGVFFTNDRHAAIVLSYRADRVLEQMEAIQKLHGLMLAADPVPLEEIYETCDRCQELFMPFMTFFDGQRFLCPDCRKPSPTRAARP